jgi:hypothetical protein
MEFQEAPMCRHVYVRLSAEEKAAVKKLSGTMIPIYASILLAMIAVAMIAVATVAGGSRQGEQIASSSASIATR